LFDESCSMTHLDGLPCLNLAAHYAHVMVTDHVELIGYCKFHLGGMVLQWYTMEARPPELEGVIDAAREEAIG